MTKHVCCFKTVDNLLAGGIGIVRAPNLNSLRMFDSAARHLNFRLAADEMNITQGAVAQRIRQLEADLGHRLFHRKARGLVLTETGRSYHVSVARALSIVDEATQKLRRQSTRVKISVTPSFASKWLVPRLGSFSAAHPDVEVQVVASEELANFRSDGVDIAIRQGHPPADEGLSHALVAPLDLCAVCSPQYAESVSCPVLLQDFAGHQLIQDSHRHWEGLFGHSGVSTIKPALQFNQTALATDAAANGQGIALAPRLLVGSELEQERLVEVWCDKRQRQVAFFAVWPNDRQASAVVVELVNWILAETGQEPTGLKTDSRRTGRPR